jgi:hypothetical protein
VGCRGDEFDDRLCVSEFWRIKRHSDVQRWFRFLKELYLIPNKFHQGAERQMGETENGEICDCLFGSDLHLCVFLRMKTGTSDKKGRLYNEGL